jgi:hypothetical protein
MKHSRLGVHMADTPQPASPSASRCATGLKVRFFPFQQDRVPGTRSPNFVSILRPHPLVSAAPAPTSSRGTPLRGLLRPPSCRRPSRPGPSASPANSATPLVGAPCAARRALTTRSARTGRTGDAAAGFGGRAGSRVAPGEFSESLPGWMESALPALPALPGFRPADDRLATRAIPPPPPPHASACARTQAHDSAR